MKKKYYQKIIAVILITMQFVTGDLSNAWGQSPPPASTLPTFVDVQKINVSEKLGRIQTRVKGKSEKTLLVIEDAHAVASAQKSIWNLIDEIHKRYGSFALHLEGLNEAPSLALEHSFPDRDWLRKKIETDVQAQNISGGAAALILSESLKAQSSESKELYFKTVQLYQQALAKQASVLKQLQQAEDIVKKSKQKTYSKEALEWDRYLAEDSLEGLQPILEVPESVLAAQFPHLRSVRRQVQNQNYLKRPVVLIFWKRLISKLKKQATVPSARQALATMEHEFSLNQVTVSESAQKLQSILPAEFIFGLGLLEKRLYSFALQAAKEWQEIQTSELAAEYQKFLIQKLSSLFTKSAQHLLLKQTLRIQLLKKLVRMELSATDWKKVKDMQLKKSDWKLFKEFYSVQFEREQKMQNHITASFRSSETVVFVSGGFHRQGLEQIAKKQGWSFAVITPKILSLEGAERYAELMQGNVGWRSHMKVVNGQIDLQKAYWSYLLQAYAKDHPEQIYDLLLNWRKRLILRLADLRQLNQAVEIAAPIHQWLADFMPEPTKQKFRSEWLQTLKNLQPQSKINTLPSSMTQSPVLVPFGTASSEDLFSEAEAMMPTEPNDDLTQSDPKVRFATDYQLSKKQGDSNPTQGDREKGHKLLKAVSDVKNLFGERFYLDFIEALLIAPDFFNDSAKDTRTYGVSYRDFYAAQIQRGLVEAESVLKVKKINFAQLKNGVSFLERLAQADAAVFMEFRDQAQKLLHAWPERHLIVSEPIPEEVKKRLDLFLQKISHEKRDPKEKRLREVLLFPLIHPGTAGLLRSILWKKLLAAMQSGEGGEAAELFLALARLLIPVENGSQITSYNDFLVVPYAIIQDGDKNDFKDDLKNFLIRLEGEDEYALGYAAIRRYANDFDFLARLAFGEGEINVRFKLYAFGLLNDLRHQLSLQIDIKKDETLLSALMLEADELVAEMGQNRSSEDLQFLFSQSFATENLKVLQIAVFLSMMQRKVARVDSENLILIIDTIMKHSDILWGDKNAYASQKIGNRLVEKMQDFQVLFMVMAHEFGHLILVYEYKLKSELFGLPSKAAHELGSDLVTLAFAGEMGWPVKGYLDFVKAGEHLFAANREAVSLNEHALARMVIHHIYTYITDYLVNKTNLAGLAESIGWKIRLEIFLGQINDFKLGTLNFSSLAGWVIFMSFSENGWSTLTSQNEQSPPHDESPPLDGPSDAPGTQFRSESRDSLLNHPKVGEMIRREILGEDRDFIKMYESRLKKPEHSQAGSTEWLHKDEKIALAVNDHAKEILKGNYSPLRRYEIKQFRKSVRSQNVDYYNAEEVPFYLERREHYGLLNDPESLKTQNPSLYDATLLKGYQWNGAAWARSEVRFLVFEKLSQILRQIKTALYDRRLKDYRTKISTVETELNTIRSSIIFAPMEPGSENEQTQEIETRKIDFEYLTMHQNMLWQSARKAMRPVTQAQTDEKKLLDRQREDLEKELEAVFDLIKERTLFLLEQSGLKTAQVAHQEADEALSDSADIFKAMEIEADAADIALRNKLLNMRARIYDLKRQLEFLAGGRLDWMDYAYFYLHPVHGKTLDEFQKLKREFNKLNKRSKSRSETRILDPMVRSETRLEIAPNPYTEGWPNSDQWGTAAERRAEYDQLLAIKDQLIGFANDRAYGMAELIKDPETKYLWHKGVLYLVGHKDQQNCFQCGSASNMVGSLLEEKGIRYRRYQPIMSIYQDGSPVPQNMRHNLIVTEFGNVIDLTPFHALDGQTSFILPFESHPLRAVLETLNSQPSGSADDQNQSEAAEEAEAIQIAHPDYSEADRKAVIVFPLHLNLNLKKNTRAFTMPVDFAWIDKNLFVMTTAGFNFRYDDDNQIQVNFVGRADVVRYEGGRFQSIIDWDILFEFPLNRLEDLRILIRKLWDYLKQNLATHTLYDLVSAFLKQALNVDIYRFPRAMPTMNEDAISRARQLAAEGFASLLAFAERMPLLSEETLIAMIYEAHENAKQLKTIPKVSVNDPNGNPLIWKAGSPGNLKFRSLEDHFSVKNVAHERNATGEFAAPQQLVELLNRSKATALLGLPNGPNILRTRAVQNRSGRDRQVIEGIIQFLAETEQSDRVKAWEAFQRGFLEDSSLVSLAGKSSGDILNVFLDQNWYHRSEMREYQSKLTVPELADLKQAVARLTSQNGLIPREVDDHERSSAFVRIIPENDTNRLVNNLGIDWKGKKVLVAPGYGDLPFALAEAGADVTAVDQSRLTILFQKLKAWVGNRLIAFGPIMIPFIWKDALSQLLYHYGNRAAESAASIPNVQFFEGDIFNLEALLPEERFDFIVSPHFFETPNGAEGSQANLQALKSLQNYLKPVGKIIIYPAYYDLDDFVKRHPDLEREKIDQVFQPSRAFADLLDSLPQDGWHVEKGPLIKLESIFSAVSSFQMNGRAAILTPLRSESRKSDQDPQGKAKTVFISPLNEDEARLLNYYANEINRGKALPPAVAAMLKVAMKKNFDIATLKALKPWDWEEKLLALTKSNRLDHSMVIQFYEIYSKIELRPTRSESRTVYPGEKKTFAEIESDLALFPSSLSEKFKGKDYEAYLDLDSKVIRSARGVGTLVIVNRKTKKARQFIIKKTKALERRSENSPFQIESEVMLEAEKIGLTQPILYASKELIIEEHLPAGTAIYSRGLFSDMYESGILGRELANAFHAMLKHGEVLYYSNSPQTHIALQFDEIKKHWRLSFLDWSHSFNGRKAVADIKNQIATLEQFAFVLNAFLPDDQTASFAWQIFIQRLFELAAADNEDGINGETYAILIDTMRNSMKSRPMINLMRQTWATFFKMAELPQTSQRPDRLTTLENIKGHSRDAGKRTTLSEEDLLSRTKRSLGFLLARDGQMTIQVARKMIDELLSGSFKNYLYLRYDRLIERLRYFLSLVRENNVKKIEAFLSAFQDKLDRDQNSFITSTEQFESVLTELFAIHPKVLGGETPERVARLFLTYLRMQEARRIKVVRRNDENGSKGVGAMIRLVLEENPGNPVGLFTPSGELVSPGVRSGSDVSEIVVLRGLVEPTTAELTPEAKKWLRQYFIPPKENSSEKGGVHDVIKKRLKLFFLRHPRVNFSKSNIQFHLQSQLVSARNIHRVVSRGLSPQKTVTMSMRERLEAQIFGSPVLQAGVVVHPFNETSQNVPINSLIPQQEKVWPRRIFFEELTTEKNILVPIVVLKAGSNYFILDGHHRASAAWLRREADISAYVIEVENFNEKTELSLDFIENLKREAEGFRIPFWKAKRDGLNSIADVPVETGEFMPRPKGAVTVRQLRSEMRNIEWDLYANVSNEIVSGLSFVERKIYNAVLDHLASRDLTLKQLNEAVVRKSVVAVRTSFKKMLSDLEARLRDGRSGFDDLWKQVGPKETLRPQWFDAQFIDNWKSESETDLFFVEFLRGYFGLGVPQVRGQSAGYRLLEMKILQRRYPEVHLHDGSKFVELFNKDKSIILTQAKNSLKPYLKQATETNSAVQPIYPNTYLSALETFSGLNVDEKTTAKDVEKAGKPVLDLLDTLNKHVHVSAMRTNFTAVYDEKMKQVSGFRSETRIEVTPEKVKDGSISKLLSSEDSKWIWYENSKGIGQFAKVEGHNLSSKKDPRLIVRLYSDAGEPGSATRNFGSVTLINRLFGKITVVSIDDPELKAFLSLVKVRERINYIINDVIVKGFQYAEVVSRLSPQNSSDIKAKVITPNLALWNVLLQMIKKMKEAVLLLADATQEPDAIQDALMTALSEMETFLSMFAADADSQKRKDWALDVIKRSEEDANLLALADALKDSGGSEEFVKSAADIFKIFKKLSGKLLVEAESFKDVALSVSRSEARKKPDADQSAPAKNSISDENLINSILLNGVPSPPKPIKKEKSKAEKPVKGKIIKASPKLLPTPEEIGAAIKRVIANSRGEGTAKRETSETPHSMSPNPQAEIPARKPITNQQMQLIINHLSGEELKIVQAVWGIAKKESGEQEREKAFYDELFVQTQYNSPQQMIKTVNAIAQAMQSEGLTLPMMAQIRFAGVEKNAAEWQQEIDTQIPSKRLSAIEGETTLIIKVQSPSAAKILSERIFKIPDEPLDAKATKDALEESDPSVLLKSLKLTDSNGSPEHVYEGIWLSDIKGKRHRFNSLYSLFRALGFERPDDLPHDYVVEIDDGKKLNATNIFEAELGPFVKIKIRDLTLEEKELRKKQREALVARAGNNSKKTRSEGRNASIPAEVYLKQALGFGKEVVSRAELAQWLAANPEWDRLLLENAQALIEAETEHDTKRMAELELVQIGIKAKIELRNEADKLRQQIVDKSDLQVAPIIFYSPDIHDDLIYLVKALQEAFETRMGALNMAIVFQSKADRKLFESELGKAKQGVRFFDNNKQGEIQLRGVIEKWESSVGIFFAPQSFVSSLKPELRLRSVDAPELLQRTVMPALPKLIEYFATALEINADTLAARVPDFAPHMHLDSQFGWTLLGSILETLAILPRTFQISA